MCVWMVSGENGLQSNSIQWVSEAELVVCVVSILVEGIKQRFSLFKIMLSVLQSDAHAAYECLEEALMSPAL